MLFHAGDEASTLHLLVEGRGELREDDEVEAVILKIDSDNQRLSLGVKQLQPNAAEGFFDAQAKGDVLNGKITRLTEFGAFVELAPGLDGLVHVSEIAMHRVESPELELSLGQVVKVKITEMDGERAGAVLESYRTEIGKPADVDKPLVINVGQ